MSNVYCFYTNLRKHVNFIYKGTLCLPSYWFRGWFLFNPKINPKNLVIVNFYFLFSYIACRKKKKSILFSMSNNRCVNYFNVSFYLKEFKFIIIFIISNIRYSLFDFKTKTQRLFSYKINTLAPINSTVIIYGYKRKLLVI